MSSLADLRARRSSSPAGETPEMPSSVPADDSPTKTVEELIESGAVRRGVSVDAEGVQDGTLAGGLSSGDGEAAPEVLTVKPGMVPDPQAEPSPLEDPAGEAGVSEAPTEEDEKPVGVKKNLTPAGVEIYYQAGPKRLYRIRQHALQLPLEEGGETTVEYDDSIEWTDVDFSISGVGDIFEKGGLPWWGMRIGVEGVFELLRLGAIEIGGWYDGDKQIFKFLDPDMGHELTPLDIVGNSGLGIKGLLTEHRLTVNHVRDEAGNRGQNVHDALELWAKKGLVPEPSVYAEEERGYVTGLRLFLEESGAKAHASEVMVGSVKHKIAGRYDVDLSIENDTELVVSYLTQAGTPRKRGPIRSKIKGGLWLTDLKTSKGVYATQFMQLEGYEECRRECGYEKSVGRAVIHVTPDGHYEFVQSKALFKDFKAALAAARALEAIEKR